MKTLKKLLCGALSLTMILSLAACGGTDDTSSGESGGEPVKYLIGISQYGQPRLPGQLPGGLPPGPGAGRSGGGHRTLSVDYQNANFDDQPGYPNRPDVFRRGRGPDGGHRHHLRHRLLRRRRGQGHPRDLHRHHRPRGRPAGLRQHHRHLRRAPPVEGQLELIRAIQPDADTIGIVYTTSEANSVYSIGVYEELAADYGFTIEAIGVTAQSEVTQAVDTLLSPGGGLPVQPHRQQRGGRAGFHPGKDQRGRHSRLRLRD